MLAVHRFDYLYVGKETTDFQIRQMGMSDRFEFLPTEQNPFHFCFSRAYPKSAALTAAFNKALADLRAEGVYDRIHAKYR